MISRSPVPALLAALVVSGLLLIPSIATAQGYGGGGFRGGVAVVRQPRFAVQRAVVVRQAPVIVQRQVVVVQARRRPTIIGRLRGAIRGFSGH